MTERPMPGPGTTERTYGRVPGFLAPPFLRTIGLAAAVALAVELVLFPRLVAIDAAVWRLVLFWRDCGTDRLIEMLVAVATRAMAGVVVVASVLALRHRGVREVWAPLAVCAVGLHVGKVMKNVFARERPSILPDIALGHSFPSAHVMNTALAALAVIVLAAGFRHPRRWWIAGALCFVVVFSGRLMLAHHWFLDALGGVLTAVALTGLCLPWFRRRPLLAPLGVAFALTVVLAAVVHERALGVRLPSPLSTRAPSTSEVRIGAALGTPALSGGWEGPAERFAGGSLAWLRGGGIVALELRDGFDRYDAGRPAGPSQAMLAIGGRPDSGKRACLVMRVTVNGRPLRSFVPFVGWREYRLPVPREILHGGTNEVGLQVTNANDEPWRFAVAYVRLDPG